MVEKTTVVTAADAAFSWGTLLLVASMRKNGMNHPVVAGTTGWTDSMKQKVLSLGGVTLRELDKDRRCVTCQKPILMMCGDVKTPWVCWADSDAVFVGDCSEWLSGENEDEIVIRKYSPPPADFTPENLKIWRRDVERICGTANPESRYATRMNAPFIVLHTKWRAFLGKWMRQIESVLPSDAEIILEKGSAYFQTDESVLGSLLCFDPAAPAVTEVYKANGGADPERYFAHFAYNPKPWQMWNPYTSKWHGEVMSIVDWLVGKGIVGHAELPAALKRAWWPLFRAASPLAPWVWRATKLKRRIFR